MADQTIEITPLTTGGNHNERREPFTLPIHPDDATTFMLTDMGNAERLVLKYRPMIHYSYELKKWLIWQGTHWQWDNGAEIDKLAQFTVRSIYTEAQMHPDEKSRIQLATHAIRSESRNRVEAMIHFAQSQPEIPTILDQLDTNQYLLNTPNGTIDLHTGELREHDRSDLITRLIDTEYNPETDCPLWHSFLNTVTAGDNDMQSYLQRAIGCSLTGDTKSQVFFFLYGLGNNGKSTFVGIIRRLLGEYAERVSSDLFLIKDKGTGGPKEGLANLRGKRFVVASELEDGKRLAVSLVKDLTGGETVRADRKYEHEVEYQPTAKYWLTGNHKPAISDTTLSIWRRMKLIPFTVTIPPEQVDLDLPAKLETELPGILAWAVRGCLDWQQYGLNEPKVITLATADYRHDQDILGDFLEDCCKFEFGATIAKKELKECYLKWCQENNLEPIKQHTFKARLIEKGITDGKGTGGVREWHGISLNSGKISKTHEQSGKSHEEAPEVFPSMPSREGFMADTATNATNATNALKDIPELELPCRGCGNTDADKFWLRPDNSAWLCSICHPEPEKGGKEQ